VGADIKGDGTYDITKTGAADATRTAARTGRSAASKASTRAKRTTRQARKVPGVARAEGAAKGAAASASDLPIARYDSLTADEIVARLSELSQIDLAKVQAYERKNGSRATVLGRIDSLQTSEPWPGYDELTVEEIRVVLAEADADRARTARTYERAHKNRAGVVDVAERELANA
jgi:hypothetical protein